MFKTWMNENLVNKLDLEGIVCLNPDAIDNASLVRDEIISTISQIDNALKYSKFVSNHIEDIKHNIKILDDCCYSLLDETKGWDTMTYLNDDTLSSIREYFDFFDGEIEGASPITMRCSGVSVPDEPFSSALKSVESLIKSSFDKNKAYESGKKKILSCITLSKVIAKNMKSLIKYDIRTDYPDFDDSGIGNFEKILSSKPDWELSDVEDIENSLLDAKDQLECVDKILNGTV